MVLLFITHSQISLAPLYQKHAHSIKRLIKIVYVKITQVATSKKLVTKAKIN